MVNNEGYAYPFSSYAGVSKATGFGHALYHKFLGIALSGSALGVTGRVTVAQSGVFRFLLRDQTGVTAGNLISSVSPHVGLKAATGGASRNVVTDSATLSGLGTTAYLGYIIKTESGASFVDFRLRTAYGLDGLAT